MKKSPILFYSDSDLQRTIPILEDKNKRCPFYRDWARLMHSPSFRRLQGKTQLFAGLESDFFRNRLTHSLEVAQIARGIGETINYKLTKQPHKPINIDLLMFAGLAHDIGHPPFGHAGERILNTLMKSYGGFESNAQNLRILAKLEKKLDDLDTSPWSDGIWYDGTGKERSTGLNLTFRSLASILKYDRKINYNKSVSKTKEKKNKSNCPVCAEYINPDSIGKNKKKDKPLQGYYSSEETLVERIKKAVAGNSRQSDFKTIECWIMDLADDIAFSTYDIEDAFKGGILLPSDVYSPSESVLNKVIEETKKESGVSIDKITAVRIVRAIFGDLGLEDIIMLLGSKQFNKDGYLRTDLTSQLVKDAIEKTSIVLNKTNPSLSKVEMDQNIKIRVSVLKNLVYELIINSNRLKIIDYQGTRIIREIFIALASEQGPELLPEDFRNKYAQAKSDEHKYRTICDFIAGMTDRYAIEFHSRLTSNQYHTMFKPYD